MDKRYRVEIQMSGETEVTDKFMREVDDSLSGIMQSYSIDGETYNMELEFTSDIAPADIRAKYLWPIIQAHPDIYYIDVEYIYYGEFTPDRFVMWTNGMLTEYTGHIYYTEDSK